MLAGCTTPASAPPEEGEGSASDPALAAAALPDETAPTPAPTPTLTPFGYQGRTGLGACAFVTGELCVFAGPSENRLHEVEAPGNLTRVAGNLTWTAASPATSTLRVFLVHREGEDWVWSDGDPFAEGTSPIVFDWDLSFRAGWRAGLVVNAFHGVAFAGAEAPQDYQVEGAATSLPAA